MLHVIGRVESPSAAVNRHPLDERAAFELLAPMFDRRTALMLQAFYPRLADALAGAFADLAAAARRQLGTLAKLSGGPDPDPAIPADVRAEIRTLAARTAWFRSAESCAVAIFDSALALARPLREAEPIPVDIWVDACMAGLDRDEFRADTTLDGPDVAIALNTAVRSLLTWPELDDHVPAFVRGEFLTVSPTADGRVLLAKGGPLFAMVPDDGDRSAVDNVNRTEGVAAISLGPGQGLTLVASDGERLVDESWGKVDIAVYELDHRPVVGLVRSGPGHLEGSIVWDPEVISLEQVGGTTLFKAKVGEDGRLLRSGGEGLRGERVALTKDRAVDAQRLSLVVDQ